MFGILLSTEVDAESFDKRIVSTDWLVDEMLTWKNLILLVLIAVMILVTKCLFVTPVYIRKYTFNKEELADFHTIDETLVKSDNKAVAIQYAGFLLGSGFMLRGAFSTDKSELGDQLIDCFVFSIIGFLLLGISHFITEQLILYQIDTIVKVYRDHNTAVAWMVAALHICTGLIVGYSVTANSTDDLGLQIGSTVFFWFVGHCFLVVFAWLYMMLTVAYDDLELLVKGNVAAAVGFGCTMVANAIMISSPISKSDSILAIVISWGVGSVILILLRLMVDVIVIRGRSLDLEILEDENWGASLIEGACAFTFSLIWWSFYRTDKTAQCVA